MVSPPSPEGDSTAVLAAAAIAGVDEVYRIGGAQAVAALAYGTRTIGPVDKIVGPGNACVQAAKRMVYGVVDIDKMAGPSEVLVIADAGARAEWVAADLIAQAEHGSGDEAAVLLTPSRASSPSVSRPRSSRRSPICRAPTRSGACSKARRRWSWWIISRRRSRSPIGSRPSILNSTSRTRRDGSGGCGRQARFSSGELSPAPLGDYLAGPNHVLPTGGAARFASPLGAYDFVKRTSIIEASARAIEKLGPAVARLARMEGFEGHARAIELRMGAGARRAQRKK